MRKKLQETNNDSDIMRTAPTYQEIDVDVMLQLAIPTIRIDLGRVFPQIVKQVFLNSRSDGSFP